ncbi:hypothetical protein HK405_007754 [Cladochytrium tenue]|nr:hypothetical protein HK405_007754 [Cladochytrium tenue]
MTCACGFVAASAPPLVPALANPIVDRRSRFIAHAARISTALDLRRILAAIEQRPDLRTADHNMRAWRYLRPKRHDGGAAAAAGTRRPATTPSEAVVSPDGHAFAFVEGADDDGEQWAGQKLLRLIRESGACDCIVVVSRWYGGEMLGPVSGPDVARLRRLARARSAKLAVFREKLAARHAELARLRAHARDLRRSLRRQIATNDVGNEENNDSDSDDAEIPGKPPPDDLDVVSEPDPEPSTTGFDVPSAEPERDVAALTASIARRDAKVERLQAQLHTAADHIARAEAAAADLALRVAVAAGAGPVQQSAPPDLSDQRPTRP